LRLEPLEDRTLLSFGTPALVSVNSGGSAAGNDFSVTNDSNPRVLSADGILEVFASGASNLTGVTDSNGTTDVYVRNLATGATTLVSVNADGTAAGNGFSDSPVISADGKFVAFRSFATDLVSTPTNTKGNIFLRDLAAGTTTLVSVNSSGSAGGNDDSDEPDISDDGNIIAYHSFATNLVGGFVDANNVNGVSNADVFARNRTTNTTLLVSVNSGNGSTGGNNDSSAPVVSGDGSRVVFQSLATDLVAGAIDNNSAADLFVRTLATNTTDVIDVETSAAATANRFSFLAASDVTSTGHKSLSADGRFEVFTSVASDLVARSDANGDDDVFVRDRQTGTVTLVSVNAAGTATGNAFSDSPVISADGKFVAFRSFATDLVSTPTNTKGNIFVRDLVAGTTTLVSVNNAGSAGGNNSSSGPDISDDGSRVAFQSAATDLVGVTTTQSNVFLRDLAAGTTTLISINTSGSDGGNSFSGLPSISGDGTHVAFQSFATDLVTGVTDTNGTGDVFVWTAVGGTRQVSVNSSHTAGNGRSLSQVLSADGKVVVFESGASNLTSGDTNLSDDVFVFDEAANGGAGATTLVSVSGSGTVGNGVSDEPSVSSDGNRIAFRSNASNLAAADSNTAGDIFVRDRSAGTTTLVSVNPAGTKPGDSFSTLPAISGNGEVVIFLTKATNLVTGISGLTGSRANIFARNLTAGTTVLVSINPAGTAAANRDSSGRADVSSNGKVVTFESNASNLVSGDTNQTGDVFARNLVANNGQAANTTEAVSVKGTGLFTGLGGASQPAVSSSGRFVAFSSTAVNLTTDDTNGAGGVFLRDVTAGTTVLASVSSAGVASNDSADEPSISSDGNRIAFRSFAGNLASPDSNTSGDVFVRDRSAGTTTLVSVNAAGTDGGDSDSDVPVISGNGQVVAFRSRATNLVTGVSGLDGNFSDIYARNLVAGETNLLSVNAAGNASGNGGSNAPRLSADGKTATYESSASNLVGGTDGNGTVDVFVNRRIGLSITGLSQREGDSGTTAFSFTVTLSAPSSQTVTVHFATADGTATTASGDYQAASGDLTFNPGDTSTTVTVQVNGDTTPERDESFSVNLSSASNAELFVSSAQGTILNDDATLSIDDVTRVEGDGGTTSAVFTVSIPFASALAVKVHFATADGAATTADSDYQATSGDLTLNPGDTSTTITVEVKGDTTPEPDETFLVNLSDPVNAQLTDGHGAGTIRNDDAALSINNVSQAEGNAGTTPFDFTVSIPFASVNKVTVHFATGDGTATAADNDYQPTSGDLTFDPDDTTRTVTVLVNGDTDIEADETFFVNLSNPTNAGISTGTGTGTTVNDDGLALTLDPISDRTVLEDAATQVVNLSGIGAGVLPATVTAVSSDTGLIPNPGVSYTSPDVTGSISFRPVADANGSARVTVTVTDGAGTSASRSFIVNVLPVNDAPSFTAGNPPAIFQGQGPQTVVNWATFIPGPADEAGQSVLAYTVTNVSNPALFAALPSVANDGTLTYAAADLASGTATFTVVVRDNGGTADGGVDFSAPQTFTIQVAQVAVIQLTAATFSAAKNRGNASIIVTRSGNLATPVTIQFSTADGTAQAGSDYAAVSRTLTFAAGQASQTVTVPILDDTVFEGDETLHVTLSNPGVGAALGSPANALVTIQDDDSADTGTFQFQAAALTASETAAVTLTITRTGNTTGGATLQVATHDGTGPLGAVAGQDYTATSVTVTFAPGETSKTVSIPILNDTQVEARETFTVTLSNPSAGATFGSPAQATVTLESDDGTPNQRYVAQVYADVLLRQAEDDGLAFWSGLLDRGTPRLDVARGIWESLEHRGQQVDQYYATFLNRAAEPAGREFWINRFLDGASEFDVQRGFVTSEEFQSHFPSPLGYVKELYPLILGRDVDPAGLAAWPPLAEQPNGRDAVARGILTSAEDERRLLDQFYAIFLHRRPDAEGEQTWLDWLQSETLLLSQVAEGFLVSQEYVGLQR
jgi:hypothetical protein